MYWQPSHWILCVDKHRNYLNGVTSPYTSNILSPDDTLKMIRIMREKYANFDNVTKYSYTIDSL